MIQNSLINARGWLEEAVIKEGFLYLSGWAISKEKLELNGFIVIAGGRKFCENEIQIDSLEMYSPDLKKEYPDYYKSDYSRFRIKIKISTEIENITLVCCIPLFNGIQGRMLFKFIKSKIPTPDEKLVLAIGGGFESVSLEFLDYLIRLADLSPDKRVLDIGCGIGRMAYPLAHYMSDKGTYDGFDIVEELIEWPKRNITTNFPNFKFQKVDIYNKWYNPKGKFKSDSFNFPYREKSFDLIFLCSVFTHMLPKGVLHYIDEIYKVLDTKGFCLCTAFLINDESRNLIKNGKSTLHLVNEYEKFCFVKNPEYPEEVSGYAETFIRKEFIKRGFKIQETYYGSWCGREEYLSYQDIIILIKEKNLKPLSFLKKFGISLICKC